MDKNNIIDKWKNDEDRIQVSKLIDKINAVEKQNKIQYTDFLSPIELQTLKKALNIIGYKNYMIYGGVENAQRNIIILYPEKLEELFTSNQFDYNSILNTIRISQVSSNSEKLEHRQYLGGLIKLGLRREKIGDIIVKDEGADIVVLKEITKFIILNVHELTRFRNYNVEVVNIANTVKKEQEFDEMKIIISSLRLDNIVASLAKTSRGKAEEIIKDERVFINYESQQKNTKQIKENDIITIRGVGKYLIKEIAGNTKNGRYVVIVNKYV